MACASPAGRILSSALVSHSHAGLSRSLIPLAALAAGPLSLISELEALALPSRHYTWSDSTQDDFTNFAWLLSLGLNWGALLGQARCTRFFVSYVADGDFFRGFAFAGPCYDMYCPCALGGR